MTAILFIELLAAFSIISGLFTEALKQATGDKIPSNIMALIDAIIVGAAGTSISYKLMDIAFTTNNILCIIIMVFAVWIGSMVGYDKVKQAVEQIIKTISK